MKRTSIFMTGIILAAGSYLMAHPPSAISVEYDYDTELLSIEVSHSVGNPDRHYISDIEVALNSEKAIMQKYSGQFDSIKRSAVYLLESLNEGDSVSVTARCSVSGDMTVEYTVSPPEPEAGE